MKTRKERFFFILLGLWIIYLMAGFYRTDLEYSQRRSGTSSQELIIERFSDQVVSELHENKILRTTLADQ